MRRSDFFIKLTSAVLFLTVACYIGVYIFNAVKNTYQTAVVISYTVEETGQAEGYIIRTETVLPDIGSAALPAVLEGEKVSAGQALVVEYNDHEAMSRAAELGTVKLKIRQLESGDASGGSGTTAQCLDSVLELSRVINSSRLDALEGAALRVENAIFLGGGDEDLDTLIARRDTLEAMDSGTRSLYAPVSGVFTSAVDGYESVTPNMLTGLTPSKLTGLFAGAAGQKTGVGKLITEIEWRYAVIMSSEDAARLTEGAQARVHFTGAYQAELLMRVESVGRNEDGQHAVIFSSNRNVADTAALRYVQADIVFETITGVCVPKEAIHLDDENKPFIFLETGARAERVNVIILSEFGDSYLVESASDRNTSLRDGATVIVRANNIEHGKVILK